MEEQKEEKIIKEVQVNEEVQETQQELTEENIECDEILEYKENQADNEIEEYEEIEEYVRTKPLGRLITLVAFTAIMLITSTYAWFSTQKNVTLGGLDGKVNVAEGLLISLDALNWRNSIDLSNAGIEEYFAQTNTDLGTEYDLVTPYAGRTNIIPEELLPVSTTAQTGEGIGLKRLNMYRGENTSGIVLSDIELLEEVPASGYYAIDFFLQNISAETATANDLLKLDSNSDITLLSTDKRSTGLQNTVRVAFALFDNDGTSNIKVNQAPSQTQILQGTNNQNIIDVAIWEPNASGDNSTTGFAAHVPYIVQNNNNITWSIADANTYFNKTITVPEKIVYDGDDGIPTYVLTGTSTSSTYTIGSGATAQIVEGIKDIYDWANNTATTGLTKQHTLKTSTEGVTELKQLVSVTDGTTEFSIAPGEYHKLRMYVWLEGQDVDCLSYASLGGGIHLDVGITKGNENSTPPVEDDEGTQTGQVTTAGTYLPTGFSEVEGTNLNTGLTIKDSVGNEYVWVEVPQTTTVYPTAGLGITEFTTDEYKKIENDLHTYTSVYRNGTSNKDEYSSDATTGLTSTQYTELKQKMLKSVYQNGGFYVGKYETGIAETDPDRDEYRTAEGDTTGYTPVIQANAYPYNWVTCAQAQSLASSMASGEYTSSLMFGVQWDLVLKYLETKGVSQYLLNEDSTSWGNYYNSSWSITHSNAKYSKNYGFTYISTPYERNYSGEEIGLFEVLLTTGASSTFSKQGISDLAGNVDEWTLEKSSDSSNPCAVRGGFYLLSGNGNPASYRHYYSTSDAYDNIGFRVSLY